MAGVAGRSGRKTRYQEVKDGNLLAVCTNWLVNNFDTFDKETKIKVALEIAKKGIVQKLEHSGTIEGTQINITMVKATSESSRLPDNGTASASPKVLNGR